MMLPSLSDEIWKLRGCISDLVSLLALPGVWRGGAPQQIMATLGDVLLRMLKLEFVYTRLHAPVHETLHVAAGGGAAASRRPTAQAQEFGRSLQPLLAPGATGVTTGSMPNPAGPGEVAVATFVLGRDEPEGVLVVGSQRQGFPTYIESLLLRVAASLALPDLMRARWQAEQGRVLALQRDRDRLSVENLALRFAQGVDDGGAKLIGRSVPFKRVRDEAGRIAATSASVLICGEVGTGKEQLARAIHRLSDRRDLPFVKLDCAAVPVAQLEGELFGAAAGAARALPGRCELAHRGTLFLHHVELLPPAAQLRLLRLLQEEALERPDGTRVPADVRVLAATTRSDLARLVDEGLFRNDLFHRLGAARALHLPPLRERAQDIPLLVRHFAQLHARRCNKPQASVPAPTMAALCKYTWPGNVRELDNVIERSVLLSQGAWLQLQLADEGAPVPGAAGVADLSLDDAQRQHIMRALAATNWVIAGAAGAAARLGMKRTSLQYRMRKLGISRPNGSAEQAAAAGG